MLVGWWLASGRAGEALRGLAAPAAIATAVPFLVGPLEASWSLPLMMGSALLTIAAMVPLALALLDRIVDADDRRLVGYAAAGCVTVAALIGGRRIHHRALVRGGLHPLGACRGHPAYPGSGGCRPGQPADPAATRDPPADASSSRRNTPSSGPRPLSRWAVPDPIRRCSCWCGSLMILLAGQVHRPAAGPPRDARHAPARPRRRGDGSRTGSSRGGHPRRRPPGADPPRAPARCRR